MKRCLITLDPIGDHEQYSQRGLRLLSPNLQRLDPLPLTAAEQRAEAQLRAEKMSIQGVQPKLSARLRATEGCLEIVDVGGTYILKPQTDYPQLPENEMLTMWLAKEIGIEVPVHGLISSKDGSFTYFIKRFDRAPRGAKIPLEDFAQLSGATRETKYDSSMERVVEIISKYCTFPQVEFVQLLRRVLFCYLTGNEDMHLKNFSLITEGIVTKLSPAYDLINTTIALRNPKEELALPLNGKKSNLTRNDLLKYFARERLGLAPKVIDDIMQEIAQAQPRCEELISASYLSNELKERYASLFLDRTKRLLA